MMAITENREANIVKLDKRVTAGLRGASWNSDLLPADMRSAVYPTMTADGAQVIGVLHSRGGERTCAFIMHPRELLISHYLTPYLINAGFAAWVQGPRSVGNDLRLEHELAVHDVTAGVKRLRELGFERIVLVGNSGGAGLFAYYNQQASLPPAQRVAFTPGGRPHQASGNRTARRRSIRVRRASSGTRQAVAVGDRSFGHR